MRLTLFLLIAGCLTVNASGLAQVVSMSYKNTSLEQVCLAVQKQTGYFFLYDKDVLKKAGNVTVNIKNLELNDALKAITAGKPLTYKIIDKTVIISELKVQTNNLSQEEIMVKGTVRYKNQSGTFESLPGVNVTLKGGKKAANTDVNGRYVITIPSNGILVFNMIGFTVKEVPVNGKTSLDVDLEESVSQLNEVIITGYGTSERKENQVGSAFQVTSKDLEMKPLDRIDRLLEGIVPGFQFQEQGNTASSSRPRYQTRIRGEGSLGASSEPLWVIDGIPLNTGDETNMIPGVETSISPLTYMNPNDIESVTVLKDATATTIYGANGSNGVILITTKYGKKGSDRLNYNFRAGVNLLTNNRFQVLNADEYRELYSESFNNSILSQNTPKPDLSGSSDWYDLFFRNGLTTQHDLSISGGNDKTRYYVSGAYYDQKDIKIENNTERFSTRINLNQKMNKVIDVFFRMGASYNINTMFNPGNSYYLNRPIDGAYNSDGTLKLEFYNKLTDAEHNDNYQKTAAVNGNFGGTITILPELSYTTTNGIDFTSVNENRYNSIKTYTYSRSGEAYAYKAQSNNLGWTSMHRLNFEKQIKRHSFAALIGGEASENDRRSLSSTGIGFANDDIREVSSAIETRGTSSADERSALSYYGQFNYTFDRRYSLIASFRNDGNSDFGSDVQWAKFKSIGAAWTISNENFWSSKYIDFAKLKLSYGTNGNSRIGAYKSKGIYSFNTQNNYNGEAGAIMSNGENPKLSWETTYLLNTGISLGLFKRITVETEVYQNKTVDLISSVYVSMTSGFEKILQNIGELRNRGIEMTLTSQNIVKKNFEWTTNFNIAHNKNKVLKLYNGVPISGVTTITAEGEDVNSHYLIRWAGVDPRDGSAMWYDTRGNITKAYNVNNRVIVGTTTPDFFGGMTNTIRLGDLSLRGLLVYNVGGYAFSGLQRDAESDGRNLASQNQSRNQLDRWREAGDLTNVPKTVLGENPDFGRNSTRFLHKKTSLRLQNISIAYSLPKHLIRAVKMNNANVYLQADNVGFWTPYRTSKDRNDYKNSFTAYPQPLVVSFGLNVGF